MSEILTYAEIVNEINKELNKLDKIDLDINYRMDLLNTISSLNDTELQTLYYSVMVVVERHVIIRKISFLYGAVSCEIYHRKNFF